MKKQSIDPKRVLPKKCLFVLIQRIVAKMPVVDNYMVRVSTKHGQLSA